MLLPHLQRAHLSTRRCCCATIAAPESQSSMCRAGVPPPTLCWRGRRRRWSLGDPSLASAAAARRCRGVWRQNIPERLRDTFFGSYETSESIAAAARHEGQALGVLCCVGAAPRRVARLVIALQLRRKGKNPYFKAKSCLGLRLSGSVTSAAAPSRPRRGARPRGAASPSWP